MNLNIIIIILLIVILLLIVGIGIFLKSNKKNQDKISDLENEKEELEGKVSEIYEMISEQSIEQRRIFSDWESTKNKAKKVSSMHFQEIHIDKKAKDLTILIVDDDIINLKLLNSLLTNSGISKEVIEAQNGSEAVDLLNERNDIDLILLDIIMPVMDGVETIKVVRADENLKQVPIIMLTTDETRKGETLEEGANGFLMKPIKREELFNKIHSIYI